MPYLLDSDIVISISTGDAEVERFVDGIVDEGISVSVVSYIEVSHRVLAGSDPTRSQTEFFNFIGGIPILSASQAIAHRCATLRCELQLQGKRARPRSLDLFIASTAIEFGLTLVTRNHKDYADLAEVTLLLP